MLKEAGKRWAGWLMVTLLVAAFSYSVGVWSAPVTSFGIDGSGNLDVNGVESNTLRVAALTSGRIPISGANGLIGDDADLRWVGGDTLTVANISAASNYVTTAYILGLTAGRIPIIGAGGLVGADSDLTFSGATLYPTNIDSSGTIEGNAYTVGGVALSTYVTDTVIGKIPGATAYVGMDSVKAGFDNYFLCDGTDDHVQIQAAIDYCATIEDSYTIFVDIGVYDVDGDLIFTAGDRCVFQGVGRPKLYTAAKTSGGTVLVFTGDSQITGGTSAWVDFVDMGFYFDGTFTDACIDLIDNNVVNSYRCMYVFDHVAPAGNAGNPSSTLTGNAVNIGKVSGPPGLHFMWEGNIIVDQREGTATNSCLLCFVVEHGEFKGNAFFPYPAATLDNPNFMFVAPVSSFKFSYDIWYLQPNWAIDGGQYYNMFMTSGADKNIEFDHEQFLPAARIENAHLYTNSGSMYAHGTYPHQTEGGTAPIVLSLGGAGTVYMDFYGRGYEQRGTDQLANGASSDAIAHVLVGTPTHVEVAWKSDLAGKSWYWSANATHIVVTLSAAAGANYDYSWYAKYEPSG